MDYYPIHLFTSSFAINSRMHQFNSLFIHCLLRSFLCIPTFSVLFSQEFFEMLHFLAGSNQSVKCESIFGKGHWMIRFFYGYSISFQIISVTSKLTRGKNREVLYPTRALNTVCIPRWWNLFAFSIASYSRHRNPAYLIKKWRLVDSIYANE